MIDKAATPSHMVRRVPATTFWPGVRTISLLVASPPGAFPSPEGGGGLSLNDRWVVWVAAIVGYTLVVVVRFGSE